LKAIAVKLTYKTAKPEGNGKEESPILIGTAAELRYFAEQVNDGHSVSFSPTVKGVSATLL